MVIAFTFQAYTLPQALNCIYVSLFEFHIWTLRQMEDSFTKHLPFWLLAKNLKKQSFEAWSSNHFGIFWSWSCALCQAGGWSKGLKSWARSTGSGSKNPKWFKDRSLKLCFLSFWPAMKMNNGLPLWAGSKLYIPSTLNIDLIQWHTHLNVCAVKC